MKKVIFFVPLILAGYLSRATVNHWIGSSENINWSNSSNWTNGVPLVTDTVFFDNIDATVNVDVNPNIAGLQIVNSSQVTLTSSVNTLITIGNVNVSNLLVFFIAESARLTIEGAAPSKGVSIQTFGNFTTTKAVIRGTFILGRYASTWNINSFPASFCNTDISGTVIVAENNSGSVMTGGLSNGNAGTIYFLNGSLLDWQRNGGSAPNAIYADGSVINVSGIGGSNMSLNSSARYDGLLIWNCASQTISGAAAILLPAANSRMDSIRVVNTGTGSLRMATNPNGFSVNSLEINGGVVELAAPNSGTNTLTDTIVNELKITGGVLYGNATFNFDNLGSAYPNTLFLKGSFLMTGGTLDFTNRAAGNAPGGSFALNTTGNFIQNGGIIKSTKGFEAENKIIFSGTTQQSTVLSHITDTISLVINNAAGVSLGDSASLPFTLHLQQGFVQLNQYNLQTHSGRISQATVLPKPSIVTNNTGKLVVTGVTGTELFPVSPFADGYNAVTINNTDGVAQTFRVGVSYGIPDGNADVTKSIYRAWDISSNITGANETTSFIFQYSDTDKVAGAVVNPAGEMLMARRFTNRWHYDPYQPVLPSYTGSIYQAGPFTPSGIDSLYVIGNEGFVSGTYIFTGTGNWSVDTNWVNNIIPPNPLPADEEIIINPVSGFCFLNINQVLAPSSNIIVNKNKSLVIPGNLMIQ